MASILSFTVHSTTVERNSCTTSNQAVVFMEMNTTLNKDSFVLRWFRGPLP